MEEKKNFNSEEKFEDIVSDSNASKNSDSHFEDFYSFSNAKNFKKNRRGIRKLLCIGDWWKERKRWQKALMITTVSLILVIAILIGVVLSVFDYNYNAITSKPNDLGFEAVIDEKVTNVALFGIDTRDEKSFKGLSDSIMILSLNHETKKVKLISVLRDSLVPITYNGNTVYTKINSAYSRGGPELAIKTLNTVFGLDISEYATVNFFGMAEIIEAVGGIEAELTEEEVISTGNYNGKHGINDMIREVCHEMGIGSSKYIVKKSGKQHLNGIQAVAYSRIRYCRNIWGTNNDHGRTDRQRYVMEQLFNKALKIEKTQYLKLIKALIPYTETSLSPTEALNLATSILLNSPTFEQTRVPMYEYQMTAPSIQGVGSCTYYDLDYASKLIKAFIYDDITPEDYMEQNGVEKNNWYTGPTYTPSGSGGSSSSGSSSGDEPETPSGEPENPDGTGGDGTGGETENPDGDGTGGETENPDGTGGETETPGGETENPDGTGGETENPGGEGSGGATTPPEA